MVLLSITKGDVTTGVSTITNPTLSFPGIVTVGNLVEYSDPILTLPTLLKVTQVNTNSVQVVGVETVTAFVDGGTPTLDTTITDLRVVESFKHNSQEIQILPIMSHSSRYSPRKNVDNVDLTQSNLVIRRQFDVFKLQTDLLVQLCRC